MNRPDKAGEPSMEEILASIRQTLAQEQDHAKSAAVDRGPPPPFGRANGVSRLGVPAGDRPTPSVGRLTDALKAHAPQPATGLGSKRPASFDDDLADILDGPAGQNGARPTAPKPSFSIAPDVPGFMAPRTSEWKTASTAAEPQPIASASPPLDLTQSPPAASPTPDPSKGVAAEPVKARAAFPPLRNGGFYPPAGYTPSLPPLTPLPDPLPAAEAATADTTPRKHPDGVLKRLADIGGGPPFPAGDGIIEVAPVKEAETSAGAEAAPVASPVAERPSFFPSEPQLGPAPGNQQASAPTSEPEPKLAPVNEPFRPGPLAPGLVESIAAAAAIKREEPQVVAPVEKPVAETAAPTELVIETVMAEVIPEEATTDLADIESEPVETIVETVAEVLPAAAVEAPGSNSVPAPYHNGVHFNGASASPRASDPPMSAAKLALDALAQGLAAASAHPIPAQPTPLTPAPATPRADTYLAPPTAELVPVPEPHTSHYPAAAPRGPAQPAYDLQQPVRTLEDAVADMLKPMLQQWLADNMPRIIEKALRVEAASALQRSNKPPGSR